MNELIEYMLGEQWNKIEDELDKINPHLEYRVVEKDGVGYAITDDYKPCRLNISLKNNIIIEITLG